MIKQTIEYKDFNGRERKEDFYFHVTTADLARLEIIHPGGFRAHLQKIINKARGKDIIDTMEDVIKMAYGVRTPDGRFERTDEHLLEFTSSNAYSILFMKLVTEAGFASTFINGLVPEELAAEAAALAAQAERNSENVGANDPQGRDLVDPPNVQVPPNTGSPIGNYEDRGPSTPPQEFRPRAEEGYGNNGYPTTP